MTRVGVMDLVVAFFVAHEDDGGIDVEKHIFRSTPLIENHWNLIGFSMWLMAFLYREITASILKIHWVCVNKMDLIADIFLLILATNLQEILTYLGV
jgi:hypothetical protein